MKVERLVGQIDTTWEEQIDNEAAERELVIKTKNRRAEHMLGMPRDDDDTLRAALQADYPLIKEGIRD